MKYLPFILFGFCVLLYANTLQHGFVLDDEVVLSQNSFVQQGTGGIPKILSEDSFAGYLQSKGIGNQIITGGRYRPLSLILFAVIVQYISNQPFVFHLLNILLFACCTLFFYKTVLDICLRKQYDQWLAIIAAVVFAAHPVHTEVVANIKSADELLSFLLGVWAFRLGIDEEWTIKKQLGAGLLIFLSCMSKEIGLIWLALIPLTRWVLYAELPRVLAPKLLLPTMGLLLYIALRANATGISVEGSMMQDPMNNPFVHPASGEWVMHTGTDTLAIPQMEWNGSLARFASPAEKTATVVCTFGRYLQLMIAPYPLTHDYYPNHISLRSWSDPVVWLAMLVTVGVIIASIRSWWRRSLTGLGFIWFTLALLPVLNLFFPVGVFMAERFLMLPSAGYCLAIAGMMALRKGGMASQQKVILCTIAAGFAIYSFSRNTAWVSNERLFIADIAFSPESAKLEFNAGNTLMIKALAEKDSVVRVQHIRETMPYFEKATDIHPFYFDAWQGVGASSFFTGNYEKALRAYAIAATIRPGDGPTLQNLHAVRQMMVNSKNKDPQNPALK